MYVNKTWYKLDIRAIKEILASKYILATLTKQLAKGVVKDGEGATKMIECTVTKAPDKQIARRISKAVITSTLFKSAIFGEDANWGRIL